MMRVLTVNQIFSAVTQSACVALGAGTSYSRRKSDTNDFSDT